MFADDTNLAVLDKTQMRLKLNLMKNLRMSNDG